jgi:hypothetical protein
VVGAVAGRAVSVPVVAVLAWQEPVERIEQIIVRPGTDLEHHDPGGGMGHEHREQPVLGRDVGQECGTGRGEVGQAARRPGPDRQLAGVYGKMLLRASRMRPSPPIAGADS